MGNIDAGKTTITERILVYTLRYVQIGFRRRKEPPRWTGLEQEARARHHDHFRRDHGQTNHANHKKTTNNTKKTQQTTKHQPQQKTQKTIKAANNNKHKNRATIWKRNGKDF